jgi:biopolymer transport protein ExbD
MRFKQENNDTFLEVNLVPMIDILMTILTFFMILNMSITGQIVFNVALPEGTIKGKDAANKGILLVGLDKDGQIIFEHEPISRSQLREEVSRYVKENPNGHIILKADRDLEYRQIAAVLKVLRDQGGNPISLAVEK